MEIKIMNKVLVLINIILWLTPALNCYGHNELIDEKYFSVSMPAGMKVAEARENSVTFSYLIDDNWQFGIISISARKGKYLDLDSQWNKVRSIIFEGNNVIEESEVNINDVRWKQIVYTNEKRAKGYESGASFTWGKGIGYVLQYNCISNKCSSLKKSYSELINTLKIKY